MPVGEREKVVKCRREAAVHGALLLVAKAKERSCGE